MSARAPAMRSLLTTGYCLSNFRPPHQAELVRQPAEVYARGDEEDDESFQNINEVFRDVDGEGINEDAAAQEHPEQQRGEEDADGVVAAQERDGDPREAVVGREAVVVAVTVAEHLADADHAGERAGD